jgi:phage FluMu protein Com
MTLIQLVVIKNGLEFEIKCPKCKFLRGGILKHAKSATGLKTNDKAKHLEVIEKMVSEARDHKS